MNILTHFKGSVRFLRKKNSLDNFFEAKREFFAKKFVRAVPERQTLNGQKKKKKRKNPG